MSFLPTTYKKIPTNSDYMKLLDGDNTFRVLSSAIIGFEYWTINNKPVRSPERWDSPPADIKVEKDGSNKINHFWAFVVWNYEESRVQILEVTQKQIQSPIKALVDNPRWGDPKMYDITIFRSGQGFDTEYVVQGNPPIGPAEPKILEAYAKRTINLSAMLENKDPFSTPTTAQNEPFIKPEDIPTPAPADPEDDISVEDIPFN